MEKLEVELFDLHGRSRELDAGEISLLLNGMESNTPMVVKRLARGGRADLLCLLAKAKARQALGFKPFLSKNEKERIMGGILSFEPHRMGIRYSGMQFLLEFSLPYLNFSPLVLFRECVISNQYGISAEKMKDATVIDAGANSGIFSIYASKLGAKKVYAFEPVSETFRILQANVALNNLEGVVVPLRMGLGDKTGRKNIGYNLAGDVGASFQDSGRFALSEETEITTLDDFMETHGGKVDFLKMDVEGYEEHILSGARKTLAGCKPAMSFSAYHRPQDREVLPRLVKSIRPDYSCRLEKRDSENFYCE